MFLLDLIIKIVFDPSFSNSVLTFQLFQLNSLTTFIFFSKSII